MQKKKGISLIVLVITIIVMIILAAAIILSLNNAGIIGNANKAVDESNMANIKTAADLAYAEYLIEPVELKDGEELEDYLTEKLVSNGTIKGKGQDYYIKIIDGETTVIKEGSTADKFFDGDIKIGDYVKYNPTDGVKNAETITYTSTKEKNGYDVQEFSLTGSYNNELYGWQVMGVGKGGELLLLSEDYIQPTSGGETNNNRQFFKLSGKADGEINKNRGVYLNAIGELNNICAIFGKGYGATGARSITVEDVNKITGYNPQKTGTGEVYRKGNVGEYGSVVTFYWENTGEEIKVAYECSNGAASNYLTEAHEVFELFDGNKYHKETAPKKEDLKQGERQKIMTVKIDGYTYNPSTLTSPRNDDTKGSAFEGTLEYDLLFKDARGDNTCCYYWLASRGTGMGPKSATNNIYNIGVFYNEHSVVSSTVFCVSYGMDIEQSHGVRAVVSLDSNILLEKTEDTETADTYSIKE